MTSVNRRSVRRARGPLAPIGLGALAVLSLLPGTLSAAAQPVAAAQPRAAAPLPPPTRGEYLASARLAAVRNDPAALSAFFTALPKGGDLHNHLSGAVSTEYLISLAADDGLCIDEQTLTAVPPPCGAGRRPASDALTDTAFRRAVLRAWSMQDFPPGRSGHDHFFDTFGKFDEVTWRHRGKLLADVADTVARQNQFYLESMVTPASDGARILADEVGWDEDLAKLASWTNWSPRRAGRRTSPTRSSARRHGAARPARRPAAGCRCDGSPRCRAAVHPSGSSPRWPWACASPNGTSGSSP